MNNARFYFKDPEQALAALKRWADKHFIETASAMLIVSLPDRTLALTLSDAELTQSHRLQFLDAAADAIMSQRADAEHVKIA